jgi:hypothetical protein
MSWDTETGPGGINANVRLGRPSGTVRIPLALPFANANGPLPLPEEREGSPLPRGKVEIATRDFG